MTAAPLKLMAVRRYFPWELADAVEENLSSDRDLTSPSPVTLARPLDCSRYRRTYLGTPEIGSNLMSFLRLMFIAGCCLATLQAQDDWPVFGHDAGAARYSPLKQITTKNISRLRPVWTFHSGSPGSEATPVVVGGVMYLTQPSGIFALEPETGKLIWKPTK